MYSGDTRKVRRPSDDDTGYTATFRTNPGDLRETPGRYRPPHEVPEQARIPSGCIRRSSGHHAEARERYRHIIGWHADLPHVSERLLVTTRKTPDPSRGPGVSRDTIRVRPEHPDSARKVRPLCRAGSRTLPRVNPSVAPEALTIVGSADEVDFWSLRASAGRPDMAD